MDSRTDKMIIKAVNNGEVELFSLLIERYQDRVYSTTYRMLGNREDALDISQEVFLKVYKKLSSFNYKSAFSTWLFKITANKCRDLLRHRKTKINKNKVSFEQSQENGFQFEDGNNPEQSYLKKEAEKNIIQLINNLKIEFKEVIVLRDIEDFSYHEISEILSIPPGTVKSRISRARKYLKEDIIKLREGDKDGS
ncbi:MAG: RNA polymerase sigma factor [Bacillota bacterium]